MRRCPAIHPSLLLALVAIASPALRAQEQVAAETPRSIRPAPERAEGDGPFERLILRGATLVDGTGAPARGPVDIVIEGNRIILLAGVGAPGLPIDP